MATRQYIGARYVPKFMGVYDVTQVYEQLCVVDNGMGTSYIAKIPTPAGTPLTDTTHWAIYGAAGGAVIDLQEQINDMKDGTVDGSLQNQINKMNDGDESGSLQNQIDTMKDGTVSGSLQNQIDNTTAKLNSSSFRSMSERKFVFIGDSYNTTPTKDDSFVGKLVEILGLDSSQYHNIGENGGTTTSYRTVQVAGYDFDDEDEITDVIITGGINDCYASYASSTLSTDIPLLIDAVKAKFPNAVIWAGFSGNGYYTNINNANMNYGNVQNIKYFWETNYSNSPYVIYMDTLDEWCRNLMDTDYFSGGNGLHPMSNGRNVLAEKIANYLKGGPRFDGDLTEETGATVDFVPAYSYWSSLKKIMYTRNGSIYRIRVMGGGVNLSTPITLTSGAEIHLLTQNINPASSSPAFVNNMESTYSGIIMYALSSAPTTFIPTMATFVLRKGDLYMSCPLAGGGIANVTSIWYPEMNMILPANAI